jgi:hypothetical protein
MKPAGVAYCDHEENDNARLPFSARWLLMNGVRRGDAPEEGGARKFTLSPAWFALGISLLGFFWQIAVTSQRVAESSRRIELLEAADRARGDALGRIDARTARIEATLDMITRGTAQRPLSVPMPSVDDPSP